MTNEKTKKQQTLPLSRSPSYFHSLQRSKQSLASYKHTRSKDRTDIPYKFPPHVHTRFKRRYDLLCTNCYFITLTFEKSYHRHSSYILFVKTILYLIKSLNQICHTWRLVPEFTRDGILHYHAILPKTSHNIFGLSRFRHRWSVKFGLAKITEDTEFGYFIYIRKTLNSMPLNIVDATYQVYTSRSSRLHLKHIRKGLERYKKRTASNDIDIYIMLLDQFSSSNSKGMPLGGAGVATSAVGTAPLRKDNHSARQSSYEFKTNLVKITW